MDVKFYSNKISMNGSNFKDFVSKITKKDEVIKTASAKEVKVAGKKEEKKEEVTSGQPAAEAKSTNNPKKEDGKGNGNKVDNKPAESSGQPEAEAKLTNCPKVEEEKKEEKKATATTGFIKIAKLDAKTRAFLRDYWKTLYPDDYVEAMLAEK